MALRSLSATRKIIDTAAVVRGCQRREIKRHSTWSATMTFEGECRRRGGPSEGSGNSTLKRGTRNNQDREVGGSRVG